MIATQDIQADQVVMSCAPYVWVPYEPQKQNVCAFCMRGVEAPVSEVPAEATPTEMDPAPLEPEAQTAPTTDAVNPELENVVILPATVPSVHPCSGCNQVWYCSEKCRENDVEHNYWECKALANFDIPWAKSYYGYCDDLVTDIRLLVRLMNKRKIEIDNGINEYEPEYGLLISNLSCYDQETLTGLLGIVQFANYVAPDEIGMDEEALLEVYCKHRVNMFGLWAVNGECLGYGVYPRGTSS